MSFANLKRNSANSIDKLTKELDKLNTKSYSSDNDDNRYWKPTVDKAGNGTATIRFLSAVEGEDVPFVRIWDHGFQGPSGKWYIENSLTTIGLPDPVSELNSELWAVSSDDDSPTRKQARTQKRRLHFVSNILVVKDSANPENEGKVFLYKYGKKIFDKLNDLMHPQFDDEVPIDPFNMWTGADFKLKIRKVEGYTNYDKSEFATPGEIPGGDNRLEEIYNSQYPLKQLIDPSKFKSYDELKKKLTLVLGATASNLPTAERASIPELSAASTKTKDLDEDIPFSTSDDEDEEEVSYFKKLAKLAEED